MLCFCCCPKNTKTAELNPMDEKLIQVNNSPRRTDSPQKRLALSESDRKKQSSNLSEKSLPLSSFDKSYDPEVKLKLTHQSSDQKDAGVRPFFDENIHSPKISNAGNKQTNRTKGQLFEFEHQTEIIYFDTKKDDQFCVRYFLNKKSQVDKQTKSILNYVLAKRSESEETQLILVIPSKVLYQTKHMQVPDNVYAIFSNMRRLQKNLTNTSSQIVEIVDGVDGTIKTEPFDKIIILLDGEHDVEFIKIYCRELTKRYSIDDFLKIWWIFPSFVDLQDISEIIKQSLRKFLINENIETVAKYLYYEIDVIKELNLEPFVIVRNKRWGDFKSVKTRKQPKDYEGEICLAIGLLMTQMNDTVLPYYKYFLETTFFEMKFLDYLKYKSLLQNQKENFFKRLLFYNIVSEQGAKILQENRKIIEYKYENLDHRRFHIKHTAKKKFVAAFGFQESIQANDENSLSRQEWDDNLKLEDLKIRKGSWDKQSDSPENDLNLIDEEDIDKIMIKDLGNELEVENGSKNTTPDRLLSKGSKPQQNDQLQLNIVQTEIGTQ